MPFVRRRPDFRGVRSSRGQFETRAMDRSVPSPGARLATSRRGRPVAIALLIGSVAVATVATVLLGGSPPPPATGAVPTASMRPSLAPSGTPETLTPAPSATEAPRPSAPSTTTPVPTATPFYEDLSGIATTANHAHRYPIAVMLDDAPGARPQSGLSAASVVWQAPVEGGIPRYMALFQARDPAVIGPVRSARLYFVRWASEWKPLYVHEGGPPPLRNFLNGSQGLVVNADGQRMARVGYRAAPHNLYTDGGKLRRYAPERGAADSQLAYDPAEPGRLQP